ncbi:MAG: hypothetical protein IJ079_03895 [Lachnospiraceae bacterium]|nr:hypothetical protein [Lachnospiraceae bacterium]MBR1567551.1 hypothetical protein [Lachnospiraceae bacterium]MBR1568707.1 hypothetical protein [Lachnospiraceae bacterium]
MSQVEFADYSVEVKAALQDAVIGCLHDAATEIVTEAVKNSSEHTASGQTKGSFGYRVDPSTCEAAIGSSMENAVWEEFGTGEYAAEGNGRKGGWWIKVGMGTDEIEPGIAAKYRWEKVKKDKDGNLIAVFTRGKRPTRALQRAFDAKKRAVQKIFEQELGGELS